MAHLRAGSGFIALLPVAILSSLALGQQVRNKTNRLASAQTFVSKPGSCLNGCHLPGMTGQAGSQKNFFPTRVPDSPIEQPRVWTYIDEQGREWVGYSALQPSNKKIGAYDLQVRMKRVMRTVVPD